MSTTICVYCDFDCEDIILITAATKYLHVDDVDQQLTHCQNC